jgi:site-specific recombinase XerC
MRDSAQVIPLHQTPFSGKSPRKPRNQDARPREYLTADEVDRLMKAAKSTGRHGHRDATLILLAYRHGLRVSELVLSTVIQNSPVVVIENSPPSGFTGRPRVPRSGSARP